MKTDSLIADLGVPTASMALGDGRKAYTWTWQTHKALANHFIKSDERCVITMMTTVGEDKIAEIGKVDDSLGIWQISYCKEQLGL